MEYRYACPHCRELNSLHESDLQPVGEQLLGAEWPCSKCGERTQIRVRMPKHELSVEAIDPRIDFVVTCPECGRTPAMNFRPAYLQDVLSKGRPVELVALCHSKHWNASAEEVERIRGLLDGWLAANMAARS
jgi:predicted nucleic-acid-binding Zn-ribbon protein